MPWFAATCEDLDDQHAATATGARARENARLIGADWFRFGFDHWRRHSKQFARLGDVVGAVAVGQHSVMADAMEALRQHVTAKSDAKRTLNTTQAGQQYDEAGQLVMTAR